MRELILEPGVHPVFTTVPGGLWTGTMTLGPDGLHPGLTVGLRDLLGPKNLVEFRSIL